MSGERRHGSWHWLFQMERFEKTGTFYFENAILQLHQLCYSYILVNEPLVLAGAITLVHNLSVPISKSPIGVLH